MKENLTKSEISKTEIKRYIKEGINAEANDIASGTEDKCKNGEIVGTQFHKIEDTCSEGSAATSESIAGYEAESQNLIDTQRNKEEEKIKEDQKNAGEIKIKAETENKNLQLIDEVYSKAGKAGFNETFLDRKIENAQENISDFNGFITEIKEIDESLQERDKQAFEGLASVVESFK